MNDKTQIAKDLLCARIRSGKSTNDSDVRCCCAWAELLIEECKDTPLEKLEDSKLYKVSLNVWFQKLILCTTPEEVVSISKEYEAYSGSYFTELVCAHLEYLQRYYVHTSKCLDGVSFDVVVSDFGELAFNLETVTSEKQYFRIHVTHNVTGDIFMFSGNNRCSAINLEKRNVA